MMDSDHQTPNRVLKSDDIQPGVNPEQEIVTLHHISSAPFMNDSSTLSTCPPNKWGQFPSEAADHEKPPACLFDSTYGVAALKQWGNMVEKNLENWSSAYCDTNGDGDGDAGLESDVLEGDQTEQEKDAEKNRLRRNKERTQRAANCNPDWQAKKDNADAFNWDKIGLYTMYMYKGVVYVNNSTQKVTRWLWGVVPQ